MNSEALQTAIFQRLSGLPAVSSLVVSIGYEHPQDVDPADSSVFPYITLHDVTQTPFDTKDSDGVQAQVQVSIWARGSATLGADKQANRIADAVYDALQKFELAVPGSNTIDVRFVSSPGILRDPDGKTRHKPMTFTVLMDDI